MSGNTVRSKRTRRSTKRPRHRILSGNGNRANGHAPVWSDRQVDPPPPTLGRQRTRTNRPWYARQLRRQGRRGFGGVFAVVTVVPEQSHVLRSFRRFAVVCWLVGAVTVFGLAKIPSPAVAVVGTGCLLLVTILLTWMVGEDDSRARNQQQTMAQFVCVAAAACLGAMLVGVIVWAVLSPLADFVNAVFSVWGIIVYFLVIFGLLIAGAIVVLPLAFATARSFPWHRVDLLVLPIGPLVITMIATLHRLLGP